MIFIGGVESDTPRSNSSFQRASQIRYLRATQKAFRLLQADWLTFEDARASVVDDVRRIREHPLVPKRIPI